MTNSQSWAWPVRHCRRLSDESWLRVYTSADLFWGFEGEADMPSSGFHETNPGPGLRLSTRRLTSNRQIPIFWRVVCWRLGSLFRLVSSDTRKAGHVSSFHFLTHHFGLFQHSKIPIFATRRMFGFSVCGSRGGGILAGSLEVVAFQGFSKLDLGAGTPLKPSFRGQVILRMSLQ